jgi:hypothetical protein
MSSSSLSLNITPEILAKAIRKGNKRNTDWEEETKLPLFTDDMIIYIENLRINKNVLGTNKHLHQDCRIQG